MCPVFRAQELADKPSGGSVAVLVAAARAACAGTDQESLPADASHSLVARYLKAAEGYQRQALARFDAATHSDVVGFAMESLWPVVLDALRDAVMACTLLERAQQEAGCREHARVVAYRLARTRQLVEHLEHEVRAGWCARAGTPRVPAPTP